MYRDPEALAAPGLIRLIIDDAGVSPQILALRLDPAGAQVSLALDDSGVSDWQRLRGTVDGARFADFVTAVRAVLASPPDERGAYDCGTHGLWILEAEVDLPLRSGLLRRSARQTEGFSSYALLDPLLELLQEVSLRPGAEAVSWESLRRRRGGRRLRILAAAALTLALLGLALLRCRPSAHGPAVGLSSGTSPAAEGG